MSKQTDARLRAIALIKNEGRVQRAALARISAASRELVNIITHEEGIARKEAVHAEIVLWCVLADIEEIATGRLKWDFDEKDECECDYCVISRLERERKAGEKRAGAHGTKPPSCNTGVTSNDNTGVKVGR